MSNRKILGIEYRTATKNGEQIKVTLTGFAEAGKKYWVRKFGNVIYLEAVPEPVTYQCPQCNEMVEGFDPSSVCVECNRLLMQAAGEE